MYRPLPSNGSVCDVAPSLRLFIPNSLRAYCHFFFSKGCACDVCDRSCLPSLWLTSHGDYSPVAPAVPSLRPLLPSGSLVRCGPGQMYHHQLQSVVLLLMSILSFWRETTPPRCPFTHFPYPDANSKYLLHDLQSDSLLMISLNVLLLPRNSCCLRPRPLCPCLCLCHARHLFSNIVLQELCVKQCPCLILDVVSLAQCRNGTVGQLSSASSQLLPGPTIAMGLFLSLSAVPCG
jgi:hypothetical protein